jgi:hypothetical protein
MILTLILLICTTATLGYVVIQFDNVGGEVGLCKLKVLERASSEKYPKGTGLITALASCNKI